MSDRKGQRGMMCMHRKLYNLLSKGGMCSYKCYIRLKLGYVQRGWVLPRLEFNFDDKERDDEGS